jgi:hypothetical protein
LAEVALLSVFLSFPLDPLFSIFCLLFNALSRFDLSIAVPVECLILLLVGLIIVVGDLFPHDLVLILQLALTLLELVTPVEGRSHHFLLVVLDTLLNLKLVVVING